MNNEKSFTVNSFWSVWNGCAAWICGNGLQRLFLYLSSLEEEVEEGDRRRTLKLICSISPDGNVLTSPPLQSFLFLCSLSLASLIHLLFYPNQPPPTRARKLNPTSVAGAQEFHYFLQTIIICHTFDVFSYIIPPSPLQCVRCRLLLLNNNVVGGS